MEQKKTYTTQAEPIALLVKCPGTGRIVSLPADSLQFMSYHNGSLLLRARCVHRCSHGRHIMKIRAEEWI